MELFFSALIFFMVLVEYKIYKRIFTPFSMLAIVNLFILDFNNFYAHKIGFYKIHFLSFAYIFYFLCIIFLVSILIDFITEKKTDEKLTIKTYFLDLRASFKAANTNKDHKFDVSNYLLEVVYKNDRFIFYLFCVCLIAKYISLFQVISVYGITNAKGHAFGIFAHLGNVSLALLPFVFLIYLKSKKKIQLMSIFLVFVNILAFGGKYPFIISMLHLVFVYAIIKNINFNKAFKLGFYSVLTSVSLFIFIYAIQPTITRGTFSFSFFVGRVSETLKHFIFYLNSPLINANYYFFSNNGGDYRKLFTVPINLVKAILHQGNYVDPINRMYLPVINGNTSNVGGLIAESFYESNLLISTIYIGLIFSLIYFVFKKTNSNGKVYVLTSYLLAIVSVSFFSNFFTVLDIVFVVLVLIVFEIILAAKFTTDKLTIQELIFGFLKRKLMKK